jgi:hypothetical protein
MSGSPNYLQGGGKRPLIEPEPSEHPLYLDYSRGISLDRAWEIAHAHTKPGVV